MKKIVAGIGVEITGVFNGFMFNIDCKHEH